MVGVMVRFLWRSGQRHGVAPLWELEESPEGRCWASRNLLDS